MVNYKLISVLMFLLSVIFAILMLIAIVFNHILIFLACLGLMFYTLALGFEYYYWNDK